MPGGAKDEALSRGNNTASVFSGIPYAGEKKIRRDELSVQRNELRKVTPDAAAQFAQYPSHFLENTVAGVDEVIVEIDQLTRFDVNRLTAAGRLMNDAVDAAPKVGRQRHDRSAVADGWPVSLVHVAIPADHLIRGVDQALIETADLIAEARNLRDRLFIHGAFRKDHPREVPEKVLRNGDIRQECSGGCGWFGPRSGRIPSSGRTGLPIGTKEHDDFPGVFQQRPEIPERRRFENGAIPPNHLQDGGDVGYRSGRKRGTFLGASQEPRDDRLVLGELDRIIVGLLMYEDRCRLVHGGAGCNVTADTVKLEGARCVHGRSPAESAIRRYDS
jgi:hypothetical protein